MTLARFYLRRYRLLFLALLGVVLAHEFTFIAVFQQWRAHTGLGEAILNFVPEKIRQGVGIPLTDITDPSTYKALIMMRPDLRMILVAFGIAIGTDVVAGEAGRGTSDLLYSHPVRRRDAVLAGMAVALIHLVCIGAAKLVGFALFTNVFPMGPNEPTTAELVPAVANMVFASYVIVLMSFLVGSIAATRQRAVAWSIALVFVPMVLNFMAVFSTKARWLAHPFPEYYYRPHMVLIGTEPARVWELCVIGVVSIAGALFFAERRDLTRA